MRFFICCLTFAICFSVAAHLGLVQPWRYPTSVGSRDSFSQKLVKPRTAGQKALSEGFTRQELSELDRLIETSVSKADARKVPKNAITMLQLWGTREERRWADAVVGAS